MLPYRAEVWSGNRCTPEIGSASGRSAQAIHPRVCFRRSPRDWKGAGRRAMKPAACAAPRMQHPAICSVRAGGISLFRIAFTAAHPLMALPFTQAKKRSSGLSTLPSSRSWLSSAGCWKRLYQPECRSCVPLAVGGHVDHRLTRAAAEAVAGGRLRRQLWYFADYPYAATAGAEIAALLQSGWQAIAFDITLPGIAAWEQSIYAHRSQISTFWADFAALQDAVRNYGKQMGGVRLWRPPY